MAITEPEGGLKPKVEPEGVATSSMKSEVGVKLRGVKGSDLDGKARGGTKLSMKHEEGLTLTVSQDAEQSLKPYREVE